MGHMGHMDHIHSEQLIKLRCDAREIDIIIPNYTHGLQFYHLMILMVLRSPAPIFPFPASISYRILIHLFMIIYDYLWLFMIVYYSTATGDIPASPWEPSWCSKLPRCFSAWNPWRPCAAWAPRAACLHGNLVAGSLVVLTLSLRRANFKAHWSCWHVYSLYNSDWILIVVWTGSESLKDSERLTSDIGLGAFAVRGSQGATGIHTFPIKWAATKSFQTTW